VISLPRNKFIFSDAISGRNLISSTMFQFLQLLFHQLKLFVLHNSIKLARFEIPGCSTNGEQNVIRPISCYRVLCSIYPCLEYCQVETHRWNWMKLFRVFLQPGRQRLQYLSFFRSRTSEHPIVITGLCNCTSAHWTRIALISPSTDADIAKGMSAS